LSFKTQVANLLAYLMTLQQANYGTTEEDGYQQRKDDGCRRAE
jgi:hypothetical protein